MAGGNTMAHPPQQKKQERAVQSNAQRIEEFRIALLDRTDDLTRALAGTIDPQTFMEIALTAVATIKEPETRAKILNCTPDSFTIAVLQAAQAGLRIDGRQSTLIPYGQVATWTPMVKGRIDLILRAPSVTKVVTRAVLDCDEFEYVLGTEEKIVHRPSLDPPKEAKLTHAYAIVWKEDGTQVFEVLGRARIDTIRAKFSKASDSPAWKNSFNEMAQKCALNRVERLIDTDPNVARAMAHAMAAEFEIPPDDDADDRATARVNEQLSAARAKIDALKLKPGEPVKTGEEAGLELRRILVQKIGAEATRQQLSREEAAKEARAALGLGGFETFQVKEDGAPDLNRLAANQLSAILAHLEQLGPGFGGQGQEESAQDAPGGEGGQGAGQPAGQEPQGPPQGTGSWQPASQPARAPSAPQEPAKVEPLICRKLGQGKQGKVHIGDPLGAKPPVCIGCHSSIGAQAGGAGFSAIADWTVYCSKALDKVDAEYAAERVPDALLAALLARSRA